MYLLSSILTLAVYLHFANETNSVLHRSNLPPNLKPTDTLVWPTRRTYNQYLSKPDSVISVTTERLQGALRDGDAPVQAQCYLLLAKCHWVRVNYQLGTECGFKALHLFKQTGNVEGESISLLTLARIFIEIGDMERASQFIENASHLSHAHALPVVKAQAYREKSLLLLELKQLDSALYYTDKSLELFKQLNDSLEISVLLGRKSRIYFHYQDHRKSRNYAYQSLLIDSLVGNLRGLGISHYQVAHNEYGLKNYRKAISSLKHSIKLNEEIQNLPWIIKAHELLSLIYHEVDEPSLALFELREANNLKTLLYDMQHAGRIQEMKLSYDLNSKEHTIRALEIENKIKQATVTYQQQFITLAVVSILLIILLSAALIRHEFVRSATNKNLANHYRELERLKTNFFTNISHEFRTPVTLIKGGVQELSHAGSFNRKTFSSISRNVDRLLRLIDQLLDISRLEAGKMSLHAQPVELTGLMLQISASYEALAACKNIKFKFHKHYEDIISYIDVEKVEKIVHNVLSNAFKFTGENGEVNLQIRKENDCCLITVSDTGIGIPATEIEQVFDRFYQVNTSHTRGYEGSGLGMALAKDLVLLHKGKISVVSTEGKGTTFTIALPLGKQHLQKNEVTERPYIAGEKTQSHLAFPPQDEEVVLQPQAGPDHPMILIAEDNADMRRYIRKVFSEQYQILEAETGTTAVSLAQERIPDLIISDIMMPEMDGYELCKRLKSNELTSHVPVILLTAKADHESRLSGLKIGADDYLSKPFDADELRLIVRNRIAEGRKMRERFAREITLEPKHIAISSLDERFLTKVLAIIESHIDDEHFSIEELSREAGFSNMHFYRKIKALSGQTPSQFLRTIRLKRAAELLSHHYDNVTQIAYSVGFSSLSYFNKCFKEQFGLTPGQYTKPNHLREFDSPSAARQHR